MGVPAAQGRLGQHLRRQNLAEGHHHGHIGAEGPKLGLGLGLAPDPLRREYRQTQLQGPGLNGAGMQLLASAAAAIRLAHHPHHRMTGSHQGLQAGHGVGRRAPEQDFHASPVIERPSTHT